MKIKRILALHLAATLILLSSMAFAAIAPRELDFAYITVNNPYMILGQEIEFSVVLSADINDYEFEYQLCRVIKTPGEEKNNLETVDYIKSTKEATYKFTPSEIGEFVLLATVMDPVSYKSRKLTSQTILSVEANDETQDTKVAGKLNAIVNELNLLNLQNDYEKALWLHDWLINNADYDISMQVHEAEGVLLNGTGVCESYALAYQMLLEKVNIPALYVTGYAGGELHAWNMVKLDDEWYHVDTTWDDPKGGGQERHYYFGLSDETLSFDHNWDTQNFVFPKATGTKYNHSLLNGALSFKDKEEMNAVLTKAIEEKQPNIRFFYTGNDKYFGARDEVERFLKDNFAKLKLASYIIDGINFAGSVSLEYGNFDGYRDFSDDESLAKVLEEALSIKENPVKLSYVGSDRYYNISIPMRNWLSANSRKWSVDTYTYTYLPTSAEIELVYGDYSAYTKFNSDDELAAILQAALDNKTEELKLFYTGEDEWYKLPSKVQNWQYENRDKVSGISGDNTSYTVNYKLTYK